MAKQIMINPECFDENFIPEKLIARENQIREISRLLDPKRSRARTIHVKGPSGTGKTSVVKWILKEKFPEKSVYVDCMNRSTPHKILEGILLELGCVVHGKEPVTDMLRKLGKASNHLVCLDEAQYIKGAKILCDIAQHCYGLILISNSSSFLVRSDEGVISKLHLRDVEFKHYSNDKVQQILKVRTSTALKKGSITPMLLSIVSKICQGNIRIGLNIIEDAAENAELDGECSISITHIRNASKTVRSYKKQFLISELNDREIVLYDILRLHSEMESAKLFLEFGKRISIKVTDRTYRNYMKHLCELGLVEEKGIKRWKRFGIV